MVEALPGETFQGKVSDLLPNWILELDPKTRMMQVEMDLENPDVNLPSGLFGYATVKLAPKTCP